MSSLTNVDRRSFLAAGAAAGAGLALRTAAMPTARAADDAAPLFKTSVAEWSFHKALRSGKMTNMDFPKVVKEQVGVDAVEYVNQFFPDKARDTAYLTELKNRCSDLGVESVLIMCDGEGNLGDPDAAKRTKAVENHYQWVDAAKFLGCHSIRVNAYSEGTPEEQAKLAADGLARLGQYAEPKGINVIVENHGGLSSHGDWLVGVIKATGQKNCGTLPDFGNFYEYDRYQGVEEMMPYAKGVSAKSHAFDADGNEKDIDYLRMMKIVLAAGYHGRVGIEWEGDDPADELQGVLLTKKLLDRVRTELSKSA